MSRIRLWLRGWRAAKRRRECPLADDGRTDNVPIINGFMRGGGGRAVLRGQRGVARRVEG